MKAVADVLRRAADCLARTVVVLAVEPLDMRVDRPGYLLSSRAEGLDLVGAVARPAIRLLCDIHHAASLDEEVGWLDGRLDLVARVHLPDQRGRGEPGDVARAARLARPGGLRRLRGLEYRPTGRPPTRSTVAMGPRSDRAGPRARPRSGERGRDGTWSPFWEDER